MKAILTFTLIICFGITANSKDLQEIIVPTVQVEVANDLEAQVKKRFPKKRNMARLYLFKNSRVKKELAFRTKANKAKLA